MEKGKEKGCSCCGGYKHFTFPNGICRGCERKKLLKARRDAKTRTVPNPKMPSKTTTTSGQKAVFAQPCVKNITVKVLTMALRTMKAKALREIFWHVQSCPNCVAKLKTIYKTDSGVVALTAFKEDIAIKFPKIWTDIAKGHNKAY